MLARIAQVVFPRACLSCGAPGHDLLCAGCDARLEPITEPCPRCARPRAARACADCARLAPAFTAARAVALYAGPAADAVKAFKLGGERRAARAMAARMAAVVADLRPGVVCSVPATRRSVATRGFDPAEELGRALAPALGLVWRRLLVKVRETADQAGLDRRERVRNVAGSVRARPVAGPVLLVDDILTTGATADACARALRAAGAREVAVACFARAT